ncbi:MAG: hypothetical protein GKR90_16130 [Pseudomonadales bacterium]|nr:hypothetical protein [Pseudomonadales bacterium]
MLRHPLLLLLLVIGPPAMGEERPWTDPEVLQAAFSIAMTAEQQPQFRAAVADFLQGYGSDVRKLLNGRNNLRIERKIASKRRNRVKTMDNEVATFLSEAQLGAYENYRATLLAKMDERAKARRQNTVDQRGR